VSALAHGFAGVGLAAGLAGAGVPGPRRDRLALVVLAVAGTAFVLRYATEDPEPYSIPIVIALSLLAGRGTAWIEDRTRIGARVGVVALIAIPLAVSFTSHDLSS